MPLLSRPLRAVVPLAATAIVALAPMEVEAPARWALAISSAMVLGWLLDVAHPAIIGFAGCFLFRASGASNFETAFAGFANPSVWFLYGALLLFTAVEGSGLVGWLAERVPPAVSRSLLRSTLALLVLAYVTTRVVPSSLAVGSVVALGALALNAGATGARSRTLLLLGGTYAAVLFGRAPAEQVATPLVWDLAAGIALVGGVLWLDRRSVGAIAAGDEPGVSDRLAPAGLNWRLALVVVAMFGLWFTWPAHGVSPELIGFGGGLAACLPGIGPAAPAGRRSTGPDPMAIILAGTALSMPVVLNESGAVDRLAVVWASWDGHPSALANVAGYWGGTLSHLFNLGGGPPALLGAGSAGSASPTGVLAAAGHTVIALYQSPALILGYSLGRFAPAHVLALGTLVLLAGSIAVLLV